MTAYKELLSTNHTPEASKTDRAIYLWFMFTKKDYKVYANLIRTINLYHAENYYISLAVNKSYLRLVPASIISIADILKLYLCYKSSLFVHNVQCSLNMKNGERDIFNKMTCIIALWQRKFKVKRDSFQLYNVMTT